MPTDFGPCPYCESQQEAKRLAMAQLADARAFGERKMESLARACAETREAWAERDAAIERGKRLWAWLDITSGWRGRGGYLLSLISQWRKRAERAEAENERLRPIAEGLDRFIARMVAEAGAALERKEES